MKKLLLLVLLFTLPTVAQVPLPAQVAILKAEDTRNYDLLKPFINSRNADIQRRAVLAAGRIGDVAAVETLGSILETGPDAVRPTAAFALGETERDEAAPFILRKLKDQDAPKELRARAVEAAGKIAAANRDGKHFNQLGSAIVDVLKRELVLAGELGKSADVLTVNLALTAALRARPEGAAEAIAPFVGLPNAEINANALNALARLRAKYELDRARRFLLHADPIVRANAARLLGAAEDKEAADVLIRSVFDTDERVRVSAIRSLATLKEAKATDRLLDRGETLLAAYKTSKYANPSEKNELLEISVALGRILPNTEHERAVKFLMEFLQADNGFSAEIPIARLRISQAKGSGGYPDPATWRQLSTMAQLIGEFAAIEPVSDFGKERKAEAPEVLKPLAISFTQPMSDEDKKLLMAAPDVLRAYAAFKTADLPEVLRAYLGSSDVFMRAAAASLIGDLPADEENIAALRSAFARALVTDKRDNDAQLAIMDALFKLDRSQAVGSLLVALNAADYLVRRKAFDLLDDEKIKADFSGVEPALKTARTRGLDHVQQYRPITGTKLGQVLNTAADYRRAASRKNGTVKAVLTTDKGTFTIDLLPEDAPLTVDNFIKLARSNYFNGLEVHRVVANFVMQDGDPRGDGNGGPGWSIRCEVNMVPYERGVVGMALSGKDTGGSQWFVTHSPQPHLDGGYTVFGRVNETDMKVVDSIVRGDKIISVRIVGQ